MAMVTKKQRNFLSRLRRDRKGTAEVIGTVMFLLILFYVFTNFYLWHDSASREMNTVLAEKMNSPVSISVVNGLGLTITNNGGFEVGLSRLWLINVTSGSSTDHMFVELDPQTMRIQAGAEVRLLFTGETTWLNDDGSIHAEQVEGTNKIRVFYPLPDHAVRCKILTSLGNMASVTFYP
jgi:hypothetical protein